MAFFGEPVGFTPEQRAGTRAPDPAAGGFLPRERSAVSRAREWALAIVRSTRISRRRRAPRATVDRTRLDRRSPRRRLAAVVETG